MPTIGITTTYTISLDNRSLGGLLDLLKKLEAAGVPSTALLTGPPATLVFSLVDTDAITRVTRIVAPETQPSVR